MTPNGIERRFECPLCGGNRLRSICEPGQMVRACAGDFGHACPHTWDEVDDWKHFVELRTARFASAEEYAAWSEDAGEEPLCRTGA